MVLPHRVQSVRTATEGRGTQTKMALQAHLHTIQWTTRQRRLEHKSAISKRLNRFNVVNLKLGYHFFSCYMLRRIPTDFMNGETIPKLVLIPVTPAYL